jgi:hypothetical protein
MIGWTFAAKERGNLVPFIVTATGGVVVVVASFLRSYESFDVVRIGGDVVKRTPRDLAGGNPGVVLAAGLAMILGAVVFWAVRQRGWALVGLAGVAVAALLAVAFGMRPPLTVTLTGDLGGPSAEFGLEYSIAFGLWLTIAGAVIGLAGAVLAFIQLRRKPSP